MEFLIALSTLVVVELQKAKPIFLSLYNILPYVKNSVIFKWLEVCSFVLLTK